MKKVISVRLPSDLLSMVELYAVNHDIEKSVVIRNAIEAYLRKEGLI